MWTTKVSPALVTGSPVASISIPELSIATCPPGSHNTRKTVAGSAAMGRWTSKRSAIAQSSHPFGICCRRSHAHSGTEWRAPQIRLLPGPHGAASQNIRDMARADHLRAPALSTERYRAVQPLAITHTYPALPSCEPAASGRSEPEALPAQRTIHCVVHRVIADRGVAAASEGSADAVGLDLGPRFGARGRGVVGDLDVAADVIAAEFDACSVRIEGDAVAHRVGRTGW